MEVILLRPLKLVLVFLKAAPHQTTSCTVAEVLCHFHVAAGKVLVEAAECFRHCPLDVAQRRVLTLWGLLPDHGIQAFVKVLDEATTTSLEPGFITEACEDRLQRLAHEVRPAVPVMGRNPILGQGSVVLTPALRSLGTQAMLGRLIGRRHVLQVCGPYCSLLAWHIVLVAPQGVA